MYSGYRHRYKWKQKGLATLYLIFLLATVGEFFDALNHLKINDKHSVQVEGEVKIPPHLPEESKGEFIRIQKIKGNRGLRAELGSGYAG